MFASGPGSRSAFTNATALESAANLLKGCRSIQMHWFMHARRGVLLFTSRFNSPIAAAPHDIRKKISMHVRNAAPVMQTHQQVLWPTSAIPIELSDYRDGP